MIPTYCENCGAIGETCCARANAQNETLNALTRIVERQRSLIVKQSQLIQMFAGAFEARQATTKSQ